MTQKLDYFSIAPQAFNLLLEQEAYLQQIFEKTATLSPAMWELVKLRVSQINQCAFCIDMHSRAALKQGESTERIVGLSAWQELPFYEANERVALGWAEKLTTDIAEVGTLYQESLSHLGEQGLVNLTIAVNAINSWNRIAKIFKPEIGSLG
ncbi:carboxymuconolactone decarboxylase family protein [Thalassotalea fusca]